MTLILFIIILSVLVFVHELGHFLAAKRAGILVEEFGFGLPPRIWGKRVGETLYSINALPIGGFVKLYGEDGMGEITNNKIPNPKSQIPNSKQSQNTKYKIQNTGRAYFEKSILQRLSVLLAGVVMNLFLAIVSFSVLYFVLGIPTKTGKIKIVGIAPDSPAQIADLKENDVIVSLNGQKISSTENFLQATKENAGKKIQLEIYREKDNPCEKNSKVLGGMAPTEPAVSCNGKNLLLSLIPRQSPPEGEGPLGIVISDVELRKYPWWQMPYLGAREGFKESLSWAGMIIAALGKTLNTLIVAGKVPKDIAGPVGIFQITGQVAKNGFLAILQFLGVLSVNLAIINILPFPALDGGRLIFLGYEAIFRKKASPKVEILVNQIGMVILLSLIVLITINDVIRLIGK